jgi:ubiquinone biosynthesis protein
VLLPGVVTAFEYDAKLLRWLAVGLNQLIKGFDWQLVIEQFIAMTEQEFDLSCEMEHLQQFHDKSKDGLVVIPEVFPALSGPQVLVMSWLAGETLGVYLERMKAEGADEASSAVLSDVARLYVRHISQDGLFHADPHPGNIVVLPPQQLGLLDFGAIGKLSPEQRVAFNGLLAMVFGYQTPQFDKQLQLAGFCGIDESVMERLSTVIHASESAADFSAVLETLLEELRVARVGMPGEFVAVIRVLMTLGGYLSKYDVDFKHFRKAVTASGPSG